MFGNLDFEIESLIKEVKSVDLLIYLRSLSEEEIQARFGNIPEL